MPLRWRPRRGGDVHVDVDIHVHVHDEVDVDVDVDGLSGGKVMSMLMLISKEEGM